MDAAVYYYHPALYSARPASLQAIDSVLLYSIEMETWQTDDGVLFEDREIPSRLYFVCVVSADMT